MDKTFSSICKIRFSDCDPAGIVFFGNFYRVAHDVFEDFVVHLGFKWKDWFENGEWGVPIRHSSCTYHKPLRAGEKCSIKILVGRIGDSSVSLHYRFEVDGELRTEAEVVHVFVDMKSMVKIEMPSKVRSALETYESESLSPQDFAQR